MSALALRLLLPALMAAVLAPAAPALGAPTRIAVIYADSDEPMPASFARIIASMETLPDIEVIRLDLERQVNQTISQLLLAAGPGGSPLRLAAAGGSIGPIAVIYPDIGEPYRSIFSKIIEGIEEKARTRVASYAVGQNFNPHEISGELKRQDIRVVIALGRNGLKAANALDKEIGVVAGGVVTVPENELRGGPVLSLAPDPALLFARLKAISPGTRRVFVAYEPRQNAWLIRLARDAAKAAGIELAAREVADLKAAVLAYQEFFASADGKRDALWLAQDNVAAEESAVLPMVLQESWTRAIPVFSSTVSHVKRGALFALFPNNLELGRNLAASALGVAAGTPPAKGLLPLRDVQAALNVRTAAHLGLHQGASLAPSFDLVFPEQ